VSTFETPDRTGFERTVGDVHTRVRRIESSLPPARFNIKMSPDGRLVSTVDSFIFMVPRDLDASHLIDVELYVTTAGTGATRLQVVHVQRGTNMLSTELKIDAGEYDTTTASVPAVINVANDHVSWGDRLSLDVLAVGGALGLGAILVFGY
jgi:hypothetical protein